MFPLLTFLGCFLVVDEETFPVQFASLSCNRMSECQRGYYEAEYDGDMNDCTDDIEDAIDDVDNDCDFDDDEARDCLEKVQASTCGDLYEDYPSDCGRVYDCSGDWWF